MVTGVSLVAGYALLGAGWLIWKTEGPTQDRAWRLVRVLGIVTFAALAAVSLATPFLNYDYWRRWFEYPGILITAPVPVLVGVCSLYFVRALRRS